MGKKVKGMTYKGGYDDYCTPPKAIDLVVPFLNGLICWEPACGAGHLAARLIQRDVKVVVSGLPDQDFHNYQPDFHWDCIVTNPPYKTKDQWIARCASFNNIII